MTPAAFNLRHLRALAETVRLGSFTAAAKAVGISQPAVTQAIARLEALTGLPLITREAGRVAPTDAGILLGARADAAAAALAEAFRPARKGGIGGRAGAADDVTMAQLTALVAFGEHGGYAPGADALGISQPSLHRSVTELERIVGVALTGRQGRGVALTDAGARLAAAFRLALGEYQAALDELAILSGRDQGAVRIAAHPAALARMLPAAIARFRAEHPPVTIEIAPAGADAADRLRGGRIDALVTLHDPALGEFETRALGDDPLVVAARGDHPLHGSTPGLMRLATFGWALPPAGSGERAGMERLFLDGGLYAPAAVVTCPDAGAALDIVARCDLLTVASAAAVERHPGRLATLPIAVPVRRPLVLATRSGWAPTPAQATFLDEIVAAASAGRLAF